MSSCSTLILAFATVAAVCAIPVDEISVRNGIVSRSPGVSLVSSAGSCTDSTAKCDIPDLWGITFNKIDTENAGNGGGAFSGASSGAAPLNLFRGANSTDRVPVSSGLSGADGKAPEGFVVDNRPTLIELGSDNAGQGGATSSGNDSRVIS